VEISFSMPVTFCAKLATRRRVGSKKCAEKLFCYLEKCVYIDNICFSVGPVALPPSVPHSFSVTHQRDNGLKAGWTAFFPSLSLFLS
jgi:hypothetical protein